MSNAKITKQPAKRRKYTLMMCKHCRFCMTGASRLTGKGTLYRCKRETTK